MKYVNSARLFELLLAAALLALAGCGSGSKSTGNFSGVNSSNPTSNAVTISLASSTLTGGNSTEATVNLAQAASAGGVDVQLSSSNPDAVVPATVTIAAGEKSVSLPVTTSAVSASTGVSIMASYEGSVSGASLTIGAPIISHPLTSPPPTAEFSDSLAPTSVTVAEGKSGTSEITTKIASGYDHALTLSASNLPTGVTVKFSPATIPAPGSGSSTATITVPGTVAAKSYSVKLTASDGTNSVSSTLTLKVSASDPGATFKACWYKSGGKSYQGVIVGVKDPGTYSFNALLYSGTTCSTYADQFGYGQEVDFGSSDYILWFDHYPNQTNYSALWYVGPDTSACLVYNTSTPTCN